MPTLRTEIGMTSGAGEAVPLAGCFDKTRLAGYDAGQVLEAGSRKCEPVFW